MRRTAAIETLCQYLALTFLPIGLWWFRAKPETWMLMLCSFSLMALYGLVVTNIGAYYRFRMPYLMLVLVFCLGTALMARERYRANQQSREQPAGQTAG